MGLRYQIVVRAEPALVAELTTPGPAYAKAHSSAAACLTGAVALIDTVAA